jgi:cytoskeletal protein CcmA (bactofilin family)
MSYTTTPASSTGPGAATATSTAATVVDANTVVDGTLSTSQDLRVEGRVTGAVMCDGIMYIAEGAEVDATIEASGIVVSGTLSGTITCHGRLEIRSTGVVRGRVETGRLIVVEGAVYEGQLRMDAVDEPVSEVEPTVDVEEEPDTEEAPPNPTTGSYSFLRSFGPNSQPTRAAGDVLPASPDDEEPE